MKFGIRKPNYKARFKARTTGKLKRKMKKAVNPFYGKRALDLSKAPQNRSKARYITEPPWAYPLFSRNRSPTRLRLQVSHRRQNRQGSRKALKPFLCILQKPIRLPARFCT